MGLQRDWTLEPQLEKKPGLEEVLEIDDQARTDLNDDLKESLRKALWP